MPATLTAEAALAGAVIGIAKPSLQQKAIVASKRVGWVEVDVGETSCQVPVAEEYIQKAVKRRG